MRRFVRILLIIAIALLGVFIFAPPLVENKENVVLLKPPYHASQAARDLHKTLLIADLHADSLLWKRDLLQHGNRGEVDVPRLIEGNVALQAFTVVTKTPFGLNIERNDDKSDMITLLAIVSLWPPKTWFSLKERALYEAEKLQAFSEKSNSKFILIKNRTDLTEYLERRKHDPAITAGFLGMEGAHPLDGNIENLNDFYDAGFRMIAPVHFFDNEIGGSAHGIRKGGLTSLGREMIQMMEKKKMIVDLAHASPRLIDDAIAIAHRPLLVSHTGIKGTCNNQRNLSDSEVKAIAAGGGIIGIGYWDTAVCGDNPQSIARAIRYSVQIAGIEHVALGSDFDGAVTVPFDSSGMILLTEALMKDGFTAEEIRKIMGENAINFLLRNLP